MNKLIVICCIVGFTAVSAFALPVDKNIRNENNASESAKQLIQIESSAQKEIVSINADFSSSKSNEDIISLVTQSSECNCIAVSSNQEIFDDADLVISSQDTQNTSLVSNYSQPNWLK